MIGSSPSRRLPAGLLAGIWLLLGAAPIQHQRLHASPAACAADCGTRHDGPSLVADVGGCPICKLATLPATLTAAPAAAPATTVRLESASTAPACRRAAPIALGRGPPTC